MSDTIQGIYCPTCGKPMDNDSLFIQLPRTSMRMFLLLRNYPPGYDRPTLKRLIYGKRKTTEGALRHHVKVLQEALFATQFRILENPYRLVKIKGFVHLNEPELPKEP